KGYFVFHDAYVYFESRYNLNQLGHVTVSPDRKPGAKTLIHIRKTVGTGDVACVFSEPQFTPAVIESVRRGSDVNSGVL
ncbi:metal ABC transporter solute-binding protein, Zn/Mn family, partial [Vibrio owensii]|uniref:metal ABC transporter solute-binding protein, Zn/Mn family n=1 Tax=Vibrio owensii TaxID=696485 RepID=UPI004067F5EB